MKLVMDLFLTAGPASSYPLVLRMLGQAMASQQPKVGEGAPPCRKGRAAAHCKWPQMKPRPHLGAFNLPAQLQPTRGHGHAQPPGRRA